MTDKIQEELEKEIEEACNTEDIEKANILGAKLDQHIATKQAMIKEFEKMIKERKKTLQFEVKLYKDELRGDREIELDYMLEELKKLYKKEKQK
jgi:phytoene/squalene synthetase